MITLITGVPGSGKTLYAVGLIKKYRSEGRLVYCDIDGFDHIANGTQLSPTDWRDTPEGSVVVYDECQKIFPSTGQPGVAQDDRIRAMETHRHSGHDLIFITQAPSFVHAHIRKLVGKHYHVFRALGLKGATVYAWEEVCQTPTDKKEQKRADAQRWSYPVDNFNAYKSATVHTHKFNFPKKLVWILGIASLVIGFAIYTGSDSFLAKAVTTQTSAPPESPKSPNEVGAGAGGDFINRHTEILHESKVSSVFISGCVSGKFCRCFDSEGAIIDLAETMCRDYAEGNLALPIKITLNNQKTDKQG